MEELYVGGLPFKTTESELELFLSQFGHLEKIKVYADWINPTFEPYAIIHCKKENKQQLLNADNKKMGRWPIKVVEAIHG